MATIECTTPVLRGQTLKGNIHISAVSPYTAKMVTAEIIRTEKHRCRSLNNGICESKTVEKVLVSDENVMVTPPGKCIPFEYTIPEDAPYSIMTGTTYTFWTIKVSVKKSRFFTEKGSHQLVVLPHILKSGTSPPADRVPLPRHGFSILVPLFRPFHWWRYRLSTRDEHVSMQTDSHQYSPGETISGKIYFSRDFRDVDVKIYFVFVSKPKKYKILAEKELQAVSVHDTFYAGSTFFFSCLLPQDVYPTGETEYSEMFWVVRAVISRPFRFTKVVEQEIEVNPLVF